MTALSWAQGQIGTKERPAGSNKQPYGKDYGENGVSWCLIFQWDAEIQGEGVDMRKTVTPNCAGVDGFWHAAQARGLAVTDPEPDDIAIYHFPGEHAGGNHCGRVESVGGSSIVAIEGNTSSGSDTNGGEVMRRTRPKSLVLGYVRPNHPAPGPVDWRRLGAVNDLPWFGLLTVPMSNQTPPGTSVKLVQDVLNIVRNAGLAETGVYDDPTGQAVWDFQQSCNAMAPDTINDITFPGVLTNGTKYWLDIALINVAHGQG